MASDISTISAALLTSLYAIPSFSDLKKSIESKTLMSNPAAMLSAFTSQSGSDIQSINLDGFYESQLSHMLSELPADSVIYRYLALSNDFQHIKQTYLQYRAANVEQYFSTLKSEHLGVLRQFEAYEDALSKAEAQFHNIESTFEFVSLVDSIYLQALAALVSGQNEYMQSVVKVKINNYHLMAVLRLTQLGRSREEIERVFVKTDLVSTYALERLEYRDVVTEIGVLVGLKPEHISVTKIETHLLNQEISTINKAMFEGVQGERIVQYFEQLKFFIGDVKVAIAGDAMQLPIEDIVNRLVIYDAV